MRIVINRCFGGFSISKECQEFMKPKEINKYGFLNNDDFGYPEDAHSDAYRSCWLLVLAVETLGTAASGRHAELKVVKIPNDVNWYIEEYDGREWVAEQHRTWRE